VQIHPSFGETKGLSERKRKGRTEVGLGIGFEVGLRGRMQGRRWQRQIDREMNFTYYRLNAALE
jgi:hypothetical protein